MVCGHSASFSHDNSYNALLIAQSCNDFCKFHSSTEGCVGTGRISCILWHGLTLAICHISGKGEPRSAATHP